MQRAARTLIKQLKAAGLEKKILPVKDTTSKFANGSKGVFVPPIRKLTLFYNHPGIGHGGDSRGMVDFVHTKLVSLAERRPYVEFEVVPRPSAPAEIQAFYTNGAVKRHICYRLTADEVLRHAEYMCDTNASGVAKAVVPETAEGDETALDAAPMPFVRQRKTPRGSAKEVKNLDLKKTGDLGFKPSYWKHVKATDWKTVGRPTDRKFTWPVLPAGQNAAQPWSPFNAERTFKP